MKIHVRLREPIAYCGTAFIITRCGKMINKKFVIQDKDVPIFRGSLCKTCELSYDVNILGILHRRWLLEGYPTEDDSLDKFGYFISHSVKVNINA